MSNRLFQSVIQQMKGVVNRNIGVIDGNGIVTASSELSRIGEIRSDIHDELASRHVIDKKVKQEKMTE